MGGLNQKSWLMGFLLHSVKLHRIFFKKPKSVGLVLSLLGDHIPGNTVEKDFPILIKSNFINIYTIERGKYEKKHKNI